MKMQSSNPQRIAPGGEELIRRDSGQRRLQRNQALADHNLLGVRVGSRDCGGVDCRGLWFGRVFHSVSTTGRLVERSDLAVSAQLGTESGAFTNAAVDWDNAYRSGNRTRFLAVEQRDTERMRRASNAMTESAMKTENPTFRSAQFGLLHAFADQLTAVADQDGAVRLGDYRASVRASHELNVVRAEAIKALARYQSVLTSLGERNER